MFPSLTNLHSKNNKDESANKPSTFNSQVCKYAQPLSLHKPVSIKNNFLLFDKNIPVKVVVTYITYLKCGGGPTKTCIQFLIAINSCLDPILCLSGVEFSKFCSLRLPPHSFTNNFDCSHFIAFLFINLLIQSINQSVSQ